jgi:predicted negative regulator of RcsB-dependent stress response
MTKTIKCLIAGVAVTVSGIFGYWCWNEAEVAAYCERIAKFEKFAGGRYLGEELSYENTKAYGVKYSVVDGL